jgi:hypothetical protein
MPMKAVSHEPNRFSTPLVLSPKTWHLEPSRLIPSVKKYTAKDRIGQFEDTMDLQTRALENSFCLLDRF